MSAIPSESSGPSDSAAVNANISTVVRTLLAHQGRTKAELVSELRNISRATFYARMSGHGGWQASEIVELSRVFDRPVEFFFQTPDELIRSRCLPSLSLVPDLPKQLKLPIPFPAERVIERQPSRDRRRFAIVPEIAAVQL